MLTKAMRKYVESETKAGYDKHLQYVYNVRLREDARQALKDLALLAQKLPEEQIAQIFGAEEMSGLVGTLMSRARNARGYNIWRLRGRGKEDTALKSNL